MRQGNEKINILRRDEDFKWDQHAKIKHVQEGVTILKNYLIANIEHGRNNILELKQDEGTIVRQENLIVCIT